METNQPSIEKFLTPVTVLLGAGLIAAAIYLNPGGAPSFPATGGEEQAAAVANIADVTIENEPFVGDPNAPVTMAFYYDIQCPFCKRFDMEVTPQLYEKFVKTGKLKIVFKDFQFLGPDSMTGALYGRAVWELFPDQYYAWAQAMAEAQDDENGGFGDEATVAKLTGSVPGIDGAAVAAAVKANQARYEALISASRDEGSALGVSGTPTVIIGDTLLSGRSSSQFLSEISAIVEAGS